MSGMAQLEITHQRFITAKSAEATNSFVSVAVVGEKKKRQAGRFVLKEFKNEAFAQSALNNYSVVEKEGFPVPNTYRLDTEKKEWIVVSDLTQNDKLQVYSVNEFEKMKEEAVLDLKNYDQVAEQVLEIATKADALGHWFSEDVYFLQIDENGVGNIVLGDFGEQGMALSIDTIKSEVTKSIVQKIENPSQDAARVFLMMLKMKMSL
jgi:hypothetical protein